MLDEACRPPPPPPLRFLRPQAYWPCHREFCRKNDFADMVEKDEPKFARWMRKHGKQAVLKDGAAPGGMRRSRGGAWRARRGHRLQVQWAFPRRELNLYSKCAPFPLPGPPPLLPPPRPCPPDEVDRVERKIATVADMYGRADPRPLPPTYTAEDMKRMAAAEEEEMLEARRLTARGARCLGGRGPVAAAQLASGYANAYGKAGSADPNLAGGPGLQPRLAIERSF